MIHNFNETLKKHLYKKKEDRFEYAANLEENFLSPDEKWFNKGDNRDTWIYIKYYDKHPHVLIVDVKNNKLVAETFYRLDKDEYRQDFIRKGRGVLLQKK
ncbi:PBECR2 nuclease fold domain-containing protein [Flavihumibacter fluvii]|uniref:PBECR2 nuclease fold domain-containing protein n=1 Tax=Flavihumibacter fluvii TaxID=2838157 RepID=UPI001BDECC4F|nr:PBECR2 nuclease fold domain-containing protein [Flavihumibacter fluvii]ULQ52177.1 hypothetical protein KJS93_18970 [Flavihumibacter fluvii]